MLSLGSSLGGPAGSSISCPAGAALAAQNPFWEIRAEASVTIKGPQALPQG